MTDLEALFVPALRDLLGEDDRPIVVYSAVWPIARATGLGGQEVCQGLLAALRRAAGARTLLMPAFTKGFVDGICDLDREPSRTGALTEYFRRQEGTRRTVSAFFSFSVAGPEAGTAVALRPKEAWGEGSLYAWFYARDAHIVTIGLHPTHCSYTHYAEWLARDVITYRYAKSFRGEVVHEGRRFAHEETLFVRDLDRDVNNDFTGLLPLYREHGLRQAAPAGVGISAMSARRKIDAIVPLLIKNPELLLRKGSGDEQPCGQDRAVGA